MRVINIDGESISWPAITADVNALWTAEAAVITASDPTFASVTATPRKLASRTEFSNEVQDDSDPSVVQVLTDHAIKVLGLKIDAAFFSGTGTPPEPLGLAALTGKQTVSMGTNGAALRRPTWTTTTRYPAVPRCSDPGD